MADYNSSGSHSRADEEGSGPPPNLAPVRRSSSRSEYDSDRIFVGRLPPHATEGALRRSA
jgi:hypothetical protein